MPLTRHIARRRARAVFDLCAGFVYSQVLLACVQLELLHMLREGPVAGSTLALRMGLSQTAAHRLLEAAAALDLVTRRGATGAEQRYGLGATGATLLGNAPVLAMIEHHALLYADLQDPVALLQGRVSASRLRRYWSYACHDQPEALGSEKTESYSALMTRSVPLVAGEILDAYDVARHRVLLDVGGGEASFALAAAGRAPELRCQVFDLPAVAARARQRILASGYSGRVSAVGGDFLSGQLPPGADLITLVRVLHDHEDASALQLLGAVRQALAPDGRVLIAEPMRGAAGHPPVADAYFGFYLLAMGQGRARAAWEISALLCQSGFSAPRPVATRMPLQVQILVATARS